MTPLSLIRRPRRFRLIAAGGVAGLLLGTGALGIVTAVDILRSVDKDLPPIASLKDYHPPLVSRVYDNDDRVIAELSQERRIFVPISTVPDLVKNAFIAAEDQNFRTHHGVDPAAITRAALTDVFLRHGKRPIGASTITQQVAKGMLLNHNSSLTMTRKISEALLAMRMEKELTKDQILEIYLNGIYLGNGAYGIESAAQTYFGKPLSELDPAQAAMLASLPKSPVNYNPFTHPEAAIDRRNWVLKRLEETGILTPEQTRIEQARPLELRPYVRRGPFADGVWYSEEVRRALVNRFGADEAAQGGLDVHTSMDRALQTATSKALKRQLLAYSLNHEAWPGPFDKIELKNENREELKKTLLKIRPPAAALPEWRAGLVLNAHDVAWLDTERDNRLVVSQLNKSDLNRTRHIGLHAGDLILVQPLPGDKIQLMQIPEVQGASVSIDPSTGRILALSGGWSFHDSQFDRATQALRQPGSSFKPFVYLTALEAGLSPSQRFDDAPFEQGDWHPHNYEENNWGMTTLHDALRVSRNLVTIRVADHLGMKKIGDLAVRSGITDDVPPYLPAALGAVDTTVLKEALAYGALMNGGKILTPEFVDYVRNPKGEIVYRGGELALDTKNGDPVLTDSRSSLASPQSVYQLDAMLKDTVARGTGWRASLRLQPFGMAGKTGTSNNFRDAWFAGGNPDLVTVVWIGYDTPKSLGENETGGHLAAPVWNDVMYEYFKNKKPHDFVPPPKVFLAKYDTGQIIATDAFKDGQIPGGSVIFHGTENNTPADMPADATKAPQTSVPAQSVDMGGLY